MIDPRSVDELKTGIREQIAEDQGILDNLRADVRLLAARVRRIQPRSTTSLTLGGTASTGRRQSIHFSPRSNLALREYDIWAVKTYGRTARRSKKVRGRHA